MTHEYTILVGGRVIPGAEAVEVSALVWAADTILALGDEAAVRAVSRGDSHVVSLEGATVVSIVDPGTAARPNKGHVPWPNEGHPAWPDRGHVAWPSEGRLQVGGRADFAVLDGDPRTGGPDASAVRVIPVVVGGHVVAGSLGRPAGADEAADANSGGLEPTASG